MVDSASDELYHSRWDVVDGETVVRAPFAGVAETLNSELLNAPKRLDELAEGSEGGCSMAEGEDVPDDSWLLVVRSSPAAVVVDGVVLGTTSKRRRVLEPKWDRTFAVGRRRREANVSSVLAHE